MNVSALSISFSFCTGICACLCAFASGYNVLRLFFREKSAKTRIKKLKAAIGIKHTSELDTFASSGIWAKLLNEATSLAQISKINAKTETSGALAKPYERCAIRYAEKAGIEQQVVTTGCFLLGIRLGLIGGIVGFAIGIMLSTLLGILLGIANFIVGFMLPLIAVKQEEKTRTNSIKKDLPDFAEIICLGLRSGLSFDQSFSLYCKYFDTPLARSCKKVQEEWQLGLLDRSTALCELSNNFESKELKQLLNDTRKGLRSGTNLTLIYQTAAQDSRDSFKAACEESNAKAPVKMMIPIGTLILPAMLLLVLGPVLLELMATF